MHTYLLRMYVSIFPSLFFLFSFLKFVVNISYLHILSDFDNKNNKKDNLTKTNKQRTITTTFM